MELSIVPKVTPHPHFQHSHQNAINSAEIYGFFQLENLELLKYIFAEWEDESFFPRAVKGPIKYYVIAVSKGFESSSFSRQRKP